MTTAEVSRRHVVSSATFYKWKAKFSGLDVSEARWLKTLEDENAKLKRMLADAMLGNVALKNLPGISTQINLGLSLWLDEKRWSRHAMRTAGENQMPESISIPDKPIMPAVAVARLERALAESACYLEYGSGGSTAMANRLGVPVSISVESDKAWLDTLSAGLTLTPNVQRIFLHADIGPTREWGHPVNELKWRSWHHYPLEAWRTCRTKGLDPDVVLIDGRFRKACFYATLIFGRPGATILFDDYENRPFYRDVEDYARPSAMHDRLAVFVVPEIIDKTGLWMAFSDAVTDQR